ncbi:MULTISPECIES: LytTR family DNA-binding domain-containing protein [Chromohalobacter]|uniref:LytTR family DNA-binding domain-containing protein n=1 Tax=Chromohalobacter TaxID=42054 RepID=UPI0014151E04|nr:MULTISPECIES: LytTR family DNA-binding domain-containing protein [Chromohalobacter]MCI0509974.1 LytTR family transcriptional regulator [Chromohalobacter sp.]MCI0593094.1 LytTR family transcriptional regulator [Chromohalobacter sp.]
MKGQALQLALREMRSDLADIRMLAVLAALIVVLVVSGPFGTLHAMGLMARVGYWSVLLLLTVSAGSLFGAWARLTLDAYGYRHGSRCLLIGAVMGLPVSLVVIAIDTLTFGAEVLMLPNLLQALGNVFLICTVLAGVLPLLGVRDRFAATPAETSRAEDDPPELLRRLPVDKRGDVISISACDHYVRVVTTRGETMLLMRLRDAIEETRPLPGIRAHRSHWVALEAVQAITRHQGRYRVTTTANDTLPVSRSCLPQLRDEGLL